MKWREVLTEHERLRLAELARERAANKAECRRIYDRCRKRMKRERENPLENRPANPQESARR